MDLLQFFNSICRFHFHILKTQFGQYFLAESKLDTDRASNSTLFRICFAFDFRFAPLRFPNLEAVLIYLWMRRLEICFVILIWICGEQIGQRRSIEVALIPLVVSSETHISGEPNNQAKHKVVTSTSHCRANQTKANQT